MEGKRLKEYSFVDCPLEIPVGWYKMVKQMLDDITPIANQYPEFEIIQIKEKYNRLIVYPNTTIPEISNIIRKYAAMSGLVCANCGAPATKEMQNYVLSYCDDCWKDLRRHDNWFPIEFATKVTISNYSISDCAEEVINFKDEWERLYDN